jgi:hypothetical protein
VGETRQFRKLKRSRLAGNYSQIRSRNGVRSLRRESSPATHYSLGVRHRVWMPPTRKRGDGLATVFANFGFEGAASACGVEWGMKAARVFILGSARDCNSFGGVDQGLLK